MSKIRKAELSDLRAVKAIDQHLFGKDSYPLFVLRQYYDISSDLLKVAEVSGEIAGYILAHYDLQQAQGWLLSLGVLPEHRGSRIGERLMSACVAEMAARGAHKLMLTVHPDNTPGIRIYTRLGFEVREELADYYLDDSPRLLMSRKIIQ